jgi:hypothetical protein
MQGMTKRTPTLPSPLLLLLLTVTLGGAYVASSTSCGGSAGQRASTAADAFVDCDTADVPSTIFKDLVTLAKQALDRLISGVGTVDKASVKADLAPIVSDAGRCASTVAVAQLEDLAGAAAGSGSGAGSGSESSTAVAPRAQPMAAATTPDAAQIAATFRQVRAELGWPRMRARGREY